MALKDNGDGTFGIVAPCSFEKPSREEALKLADLMIDVTDCESSDFYKAGQMIRRLVEELDKQFKNGFEAGKLEGWKVHKYYSTPQTKPLSDEEIDEVSKAIWERPWLEKHREFARAIEERHGIK